jgi:hypothetical protein
VEVRWGLQEDENRIAGLLELNGMPRWGAFEERFIVAEEKGEMLAVLGYRMVSKRLLLGLLVVDPWAEERSLAMSLYARAVDLAREAGIGEVRARPGLYGDYPREAGYGLARGGVHTRTFPSRSGASCRRAVGAACSLCWASSLPRSSELSELDVSEHGGDTQDRWYRSPSPANPTLGATIGMGSRIWAPW